jgi:hypothetical protein
MLKIGIYALPPLKSDFYAILLKLGREQIVCACGNIA